VITGIVVALPEELNPDNKKIKKGYAFITDNFVAYSGAGSANAKAAELLITKAQPD
jgi:hypothetical protein